MSVERGSLKFQAKRREIDKPTLKYVKIDPGATSGRREYMGQLDKAAKAARKRRERSVTGLMLEDELILPTTHFSITEGISEIETSVARRIREAKDLIFEEKYTKALLLLRELLDEKPNHHEAIYFMAYCHFRLSELEQALKTLLPLRQQNIKKNLKTRARHLADEIRPNMIESVLTENYSLLIESNFNRVISNMSEMVRLDPDSSTYHHMLALTLSLTEQNQSALDVIYVGLNNPDLDEPEELENLRDHVYELLAKEQLVTARDLYKKQQYSKARQEIEIMDKVIQQTWIVKVFGSYLEQCEAGKQKSLPSGTPEQIDVLYEFLIKEELDSANKLRRSDQFDRASRILQAALVHTPNYPYGSFLYALCIYDSLGQSIQDDQPISIEDLTNKMLKAKRHAEIGATVPDINSAQDLLEVIEEAVMYLEQLKKDAAIIEGISQRFDAIYESAKDGIGSADQCGKLIHRLATLKKEIPRERKKVQGDGAKKNLDELNEAIIAMSGQLKKFEAEIKQMALLNPLIASFTSKMQQIKNQGGINSWEVTELKNYFTKLRADIQSVMKIVLDKDAQMQANDLLKAVDVVLNQLRNL